MQPKITGNMNNITEAHQNKVIIVTYGFPPYVKSLGGSIRMLKLAEFFVVKGLDVVVVCASTPHRDSFGYDDVLKKIRTIVCHDPLASLSQQASQTGNDAPVSSMVKKALMSRLRRWVKPLALDLLVPDSGVLAVSGMVRAVEKELVEASGTVTLITSGPPHSVHLVGREIKAKNPYLKWIIDYRDSWNGTSLFRKKNSLLQKYNAFLERECLFKGDHLTYISNPILNKAEVVASLPLSDKATLITNGYDERLVQKFVSRSLVPRQQLRVGYFGALDHGPASYRDPSCIFNVLEVLAEDEIQFVVHGPSTLDEEWKKRLGKRLLNGGKLDHSEAIEQMGEMDALLLLHTREDGADEVITGKVFEYISTGLPIIAIGPREMAVNTLLADDVAYHWVSNQNSDGIKALFKKLIANHSIGQRLYRDPGYIRGYSRTAQHEKFIELVRK